MKRGGTGTAAAVGVIVLAGLALVGCATTPLFTPDQQLRIVTPRYLSVVVPPVQVAWQVTALPDDVAAFVVFVDRPPIHPGQDLRSLAHGDPSCLRSPSCPDATYLRAHNIFLTRATTVTIPFVAAQVGREEHDPIPIHHATVILVDGEGRRVGEFAYDVQFRVAPGGT